MNLLSDLNVTEIVIAITEINHETFVDYLRNNYAKKFKLTSRCYILNQI